MTVRYQRWYVRANNTVIKLSPDNATARAQIDAEFCTPERGGGTLCATLIGEPPPRPASLAHKGERWIDWVPLSDAWLKETS